KSGIEEYLGPGNLDRNSQWMESRAVGRRRCVELTKQQLDIKVRGRHVVGCYQLREPTASYKASFDPEKGLLRLENVHIWNDYI
ncbi:MAG: hypothetical protein JSV50_18110, partial [Desulfobacteraceae bacterium]